MDLTFGWRTAVLAVAALVLLPLAATLSLAWRNRAAARTLAACLVVMVGVFTPWLIGFAGFYDKWRWLTFAPFSNGLLVPPLLYLHSYALTHGAWPQRGWRHLLPGLAQFLYQLACFLLPMPFKQRWADIAFADGDIVVAVAQAVSFLIYGRMAIELWRRYRAALVQHRSDDARFAGRWLTGSTLAFAVLAMLWAGYLLWNAIAPLGYKGLMPLYVAIAGFAMYLGIAGWRYLAFPFPSFADLAPPVEAPPRDWAKLGAEWAEATRRNAWYRDDALSLPALAALLGTNASYLSRALNDGLGMSFSAFVNGLRCEAVAAGLAGDRSLLDLAFEAGFASKASFNRAFRERYGVAPSTMRNRARLTSHNSRD